jgi:hypothetical protein
MLAKHVNIKEIEKCEELDNIYFIVSTKDEKWDNWTVHILQGTYVCRRCTKQNHIVERSQQRSNSPVHILHGEHNRLTVVVGTVTEESIG